MNINYITNQNPNSFSGGWSGINRNIYNQLTKDFDVNYIGPISPPSFIFEKIYSKLTRSIGLKGNFHFFSEKRLQRIKTLVSEKILPADYNFFFGQSPWIKIENNMPYGVYMDADFLTYLEIYSNPEKFSKRDILRIAKLEEIWLQKSSHIFIGSNWAWNMMCKHYDIEENKKVTVYTGGNIPLPETDSFAGDLIFLFISLNFEKKGGPICIEAFKQIKTAYPISRLDIIGQRPPDKYLNNDGVNYMGFIDKNNPNDLERLQKALSKAFFLIHPTTMDTMGAVLLEAGYYGCPSIAPKSFGIPELIINNQTGVVVDTPFKAFDFVEPILFLIENKKDYLKMRKVAWEYTRNKLTWTNIGGLIASTIKG